MKRNYLIEATFICGPAALAILPNLIGVSAFAVAFALVAFLVRMQVVQAVAQAEEESAATIESLRQKLEQLDARVQEIILKRVR